MKPETLSAYLDGELSPEEAARVEQALRADPALEAELTTLRAVDRALDVLPGCEAPDDLEQRVRAALATRRRGRLIMLVSAAAAAAAILVAVLLTQGGAEQTRGLPEVPVATEYEWEFDEDLYQCMGLDAIEEAVLEELGTT